MNHSLESRCSRRTTSRTDGVALPVLRSLVGGPCAMASRSILDPCVCAVVALTLLSVSLNAQVQGQGNALQVGSLSTYSTLPGADGLRLVGVSFRISNNSTAVVTPLESITATIAFGTNSATLAVPALAPGNTAYVSRTVETGSAQVAISITVTGQPLLAGGSNQEQPTTNADSGAR